MRTNHSSHDTNPIVSVLFVCMGNICRSPLAEGLFREHVTKADLTERIRVDSAGTHAYHIGSPPDPRSIEIARQHRIDLTWQRARRVHPEDFVQFDYLLAMDQQNIADLQAICPSPEWHHKIQLLLDYAPHLPDDEIPDPYYGGITGFSRVFDLIDEACIGLLQQLRRQHSL